MCVDSFICDKINSIETLNRISIIGISASGKSTFSRKLAEQTKLPLFHMDILFWKGNWEEVPEVIVLENHKKLIQQDRWIIEGFIDEKMADRLTRSDMVIFLDYSGWFCAWRVFLRWVKHRKASRPELPDEALEELHGDFVWRVFRRKERENIEDALRCSNVKKMLVAYSPKDLGVILKDISYLRIP